MKKRLKKYCETIDELMYFNWEMAKKKMDFSYLRINKPTEPDRSEEGFEAYCKIQDEIFDEYGVSDNLKELFALKLKWIIKKGQAVARGDRFANMEAKIIRADIDLLFKENETDEQANTLIKISKIMGYHIDPRKITVRDFYEYLNSAVNG